MVAIPPNLDRPRNWTIYGYHQDGERYVIATGLTLEESVELLRADAKSEKAT